MLLLVHHIDIYNNRVNSFLIAYTCNTKHSYHSYHYCGIAHILYKYSVFHVNLDTIESWESLVVSNSCVLDAWNVVAISTPSNCFSLEVGTQRLVLASCRFQENDFGYSMPSKMFELFGVELVVVCWWHRLEVDVSRDADR